MLLKTVRKLKPDVVWFNLVFSSFATPEKPFAAFLGLSAPALLRAAGFCTHVTLHHITEHVDFAGSGVQGPGERMFRIGSELATRTLLKAHSVSVCFPDTAALSLKNTLPQRSLSNHGTFARNPTPPDFSKRGNPEKRILAIGRWGIYKRLETLMKAFPLVLKKVPNARFI